MFKKINGQKGLTLVELMIIVIVIGLLAAIAVPKFLDTGINSRANICKSNRSAIKGAIERFLMSCGGETLPVIDIQEDWEAYLENGIMPICPSLGTYHYNNSPVRGTARDDGTASSYTVHCSAYDAINHNCY